MIWHITVKDLKRMLRDRKALLLSILMPFILTTILGFSVGKMLGNEIQLTTAEVAVVIADDFSTDKAEMEAFLASDLLKNNLTDSDKQKLLQSIDDLDFTKIFTENVLENEKVKEFVSYKIMDEQSARKKLDHGDLTAIIIIPEKFSYHTWINMFFPFRNPVEIKIIENPDHGLKAGIVKSIVKGYTDRLSAGIIAKNVFLETAIELNAGTKVYEQLDMFMDQLMSKEYKEAKLEYVAIEGKKHINGFQYYAAAMGAMFILFSAVLGAQYTLNEKQFYTYERLKITGLGLTTILSGRFFSTSLFTFIQLGILITSSFFMFNVEWGNWLNVLLLSVLTSLAIGSLSVLLSVITLISNNDRIAQFFQSIIVPVMSLVGGSFVPNNSMPALIKNIGDFTVNGAALKGYMKIMQGYSLVELQSIILTITIFTLIMLASTVTIAKIREV